MYIIGFGVLTFLYFLYKLNKINEKNNLKKNTNKKKIIRKYINTTKTKFR